MNGTKNYKCRFLDPVIEYIQTYTGHGDFRLDEELVDEVCHGLPDGPFHHDEFDCINCKYFEE